MSIKWFSTKEKIGSASFYATNITLNTIASVPFEYAYRVQVGIDDNGNIVIEPLSKERIIRGDLDEYDLLTIAVKKTYSRISSTALMKRIQESLNINLKENSMKFDTKWVEKDNLLIILTGKENN